MRGKRKSVCVRSSVPSIIAALGLLLAFVIGGCGGGGGEAYRKAVLDAWSRLQAASGKLGRAANRLESLEDLEDVHAELAGAREEIATFEDELGNLDVPGELAESHRALEDFLSAYDAYLGGMEEMLEAFSTGEDMATFPTLAPRLEQAEESLADYRESQDYNPALLDGDIGDVLHLLDEFLGSVTYVESESLFIVDAWYSAFNAGDGEAMYALLDAESPILEDLSRESFLTQVEEAYQGGLRAVYRVTGGESSADEDGEWHTAFLSVDYSATVDMEGNPVPPGSEDVRFTMVNRGNGWYLYDIQGGMRIF